MGHTPKRAPLWKRKSHGSSHLLAWAPGPASHEVLRSGGEKLLTWKLKSFVNNTNRHEHSTFKPICLDPQKRKKTLKSCFEVLAVSAFTLNL
jgi:hypothetical protein